MRITITIEAPNMPAKYSMSSGDNEDDLGKAVKMAFDGLRRERPDVSLFDMKIKIDSGKAE